MKYIKDNYKLYNIIDKDIILRASPIKDDPPEFNIYLDIYPCHHNISLMKNVNLNKDGLILVQNHYISIVENFLMSKEVMIFDAKKAFKNLLEQLNLD